ncbi:MAG: hypothetical protein AAF193_11680, partial [Bacteroidota bacterium]
PDNQCPGVRLMFSNGNDYLSMERGKIIGATLVQTEFPFPRNEWVNVRWVMQLSDSDDGLNQIYINDQLSLEELGFNLPNAQDFAAAFAEFEIDFQLQASKYERFQIGLTANPTNQDLEIFVDDVSIEIE